jgi:thioredoxin-dependent peroxiredoxin
MSDLVAQAIFLAHLAATLYMTGLIWMVQKVSYPLMASVGQAESKEFERLHCERIAWVVGLPMLVEGITGLVLLWYCPPWFPAWGFWLGAVLLFGNAASTQFLQVPCHKKLAAGFDRNAHQRLVKTNWIRTLLWSLRSCLVIAMLFNILVITGFPRSGNFSNLSAESVMATLKIGDRAPDFTAKTSAGNVIRLADYVGKKGLVLFFYPKDGTPVCTKEACAFRDSYMQFADAGAEVIGISSDSDESHLDFAKQYRLTFPLISDADGSLRKLFAVPKTLGLFPGRVTYVIDKDGIIRQIYSAQLASDAHVKQALAALGQ